MAGKGKKRQFGSVRELPSGKFQASYPNPSGKGRIAAPKTFERERDANAWLAGVLTDITRGVLQKPTTESVLFDEYAVKWMDSRPKPLAPRSIDTYQRNLRLHILPTFGDMSLTEIASNPARVREWFAALGRKTGPSAQGLAYTLLKAILATAFEDELIPRNPCKFKATDNGHTPREANFLSPDHVAVVANTVQPRYRAMVLIAAYGHLRHAELIGLQRSDINIEANTITVNTQLQRFTVLSAKWQPKRKGSKGQWVQLDPKNKGQWVRVEPKSKAGKRTINLSEMVMQELAKHLLQFVDDAPEAIVFTAPTGNPVNRGSYNAMLKTAGRKIGFPGLHSHDLRHSGLTWGGQEGYTMAEMMKRGGHASLQVAMRYQHATTDRDRALADRLNDRFVAAQG